MFNQPDTLVKTIYLITIYIIKTKEIMKNSESKLLLGLGIGVALGAAIGYIMGNDKREEWLDQANEFADKVRANVKTAVYKGKHEVEDLREDIEDITEVAKKELSRK